jgi:hypothetical protein
MKITKRQLRQIIRESVTRNISEQVGTQPKVDDFEFDDEDQTGVTYDVNGDEIGEFKYEVHMNPPERSSLEYPGYGGDIEITELSYTSGPYQGQDVKLNSNMFNSLERMIFDERLGRRRPYGGRRF